MGKTNKIARYVEDLQGLERPVARNLQAKPTGLYLLELRTHRAIAQAPAPRRKLVVTIVAKEGFVGTSKPVKIVHR